MSYIVSTDRVTKRYKNFTAIEDVSIHVEEGAVYGLIGKNGAGKTTLLKMIAGISRPTGGKVEYFMRDGSRPRIGALIEAPGIFPNLTARQNLEIKRLSFGGTDENEAKRLLEYVGLRQWVDVKTSAFSLGMKQRLGIAMAMIGDPDILILDEPINGLDPQGVKDVRLIIKKLNQEEHKTIIVSSHMLEELSKVATVYGVIDNGQLVNEASEEEIMSKMPGYVKLIVDPIADARRVLDEMGIYSYQSKTEHILHVLEQLDRRDEMLERMIGAGIHITECQVIRETLEDYYMNVTKQEVHYD